MPLPAVWAEDQRALLRRPPPQAAARPEQGPAEPVRRPPPPEGRLRSFRRSGCLAPVWRRSWDRPAPAGTAEDPAWRRRKYKTARPPPAACRNWNNYSWQLPLSQILSFPVSRLSLLLFNHISGRKTIGSCHSGQSFPADGPFSPFKANFKGAMEKNDGLFPTVCYNTIVG